MRRSRLSLPIFLACVFILSACLPTNSTQPTLTHTPTATKTATPTPTIVWFPPTATPTPFPTVAPTSTPNLRPGLGEPLFADDFSTSGEWALSSTSAGSVALGVNELTIAIAAPRTYLYSIREQPVLSDFYLEISANPTLCHGADEYGLLLRYTSPQNFYRYELSCDGRVSLIRVYKGMASSPQPWLESGVVPPGAPSLSRLAVWLVGKEMRFFVNDIYLFTVNEPTIPSGVIGVYARSTGELAVTVNFSELVVRQIDK